MYRLSIDLSIYLSMYRSIILCGHRFVCLSVCQLANQSAAKNRHREEDKDAILDYIFLKNQGTRLRVHVLTIICLHCIPLTIPTQVHVELYNGYVAHSNEYFKENRLLHNVTPEL